MDKRVIDALGAPSPTLRRRIDHFDICRIGGFKVVTAGRADLADAIVEDCLATRATHGPAALFFDANAHGISLLERDHDYRNAIEQAEVIHADGGFLVTISQWFMRQKIVERSATTDMILDIAARSAKAGTRFYMLGATESVNSRCADMLSLTFPGLHIAGRRNGYFSDDDIAGLIDEINALEVDILWVGLGKPLEQTFSARYRDALKVGCIITCGGCFNFVVGDYQRAPPWMQRNNLEWLHRLMSRPRQLFLRYVTTIPHAIWLVWKHRTKNGAAELRK